MFYFLTWNWLNNVFCLLISWLEYEFLCHQIIIFRARKFWILKFSNLQFSIFRFNEFFNYRILEFWYFWILQFWICMIKSAVYAILLQSFWIFKTWKFSIPEFPNLFSIFESYFWMFKFFIFWTFWISEFDYLFSNDFDTLA